MLATDPDDRYPTAPAVMSALVPFLSGSARDRALAAWPGKPAPADDFGTAPPRILVVDDEQPNRQLCGLVLGPEGMLCDEAQDGEAGLAALQGRPYDLVLLDVHLPGMSGGEVLRRVRQAPPGPYLKVIMLSGQAAGDEMAKMLLAGADDFLLKPFTVTQLKARVKAALRLRAAQQRSARLNQQLLAVNHEREQALSARESDLVHARNALVLALAELGTSRGPETGAHLRRLQRYCRCLGEEASTLPAFATQIDAGFLGMLECCAPLHDIGKAGLPDRILLEAGPLSPEERLIMQAHTTIGASILEKVARRHGFARSFLQMAGDIVRHHHERWDGTGYPDRLAGEDIPLSARIVTLGDVYDGLRSRRPYKPSLPHEDVVRLMVEGSPGQFDPALLRAFQGCASRLGRLFDELPD